MTVGMSSSNDSIIDPASEGCVPSASLATKTRSRSAVNTRRSAQVITSVFSDRPLAGDAVHGNTNTKLRAKVTKHT